MNEKNYRRFAFRTNALKITEWAREAEKRNVSLSSFIRSAADKERASMSDSELDRHLLAMRVALNSAMQVRTAAQKNARMTTVRDHLTALIHRKPTNYWK